MPTEAELLADLLDGRLDPADAPPELAELADLAGAVRDHVVLVPPTDAFRESLREQLVQSGAGPASGGTGGSGAGGSGGGPAGGVAPAATTAASGGLSAVVAGVAATAVLATSVVAAADRAGPGDLLAGVDRGIESVQLAIADAEREAELLVDFAAERVLEAVDVVDPAVVAELLGTASDLLDDAISLAVEQGRDIDALVAPYTASLRTLASRTDDAVVEAEIAQRLAELGADGVTSDGGTAGAGDAATGADGDQPSDDGAAADGTSGGDQQSDQAGATDDADDTNDVVDEVEDTVDDATDTLDDPVDEVEDTVDDVTDTVDDATDTADDVTDTVDDAAEDLTGN